MAAKKRSKVRKYRPTLIDSHIARLRVGVTYLNQLLDYRYFAESVEPMEEERELLSEMIDWLEARRDVV